MLSLWKHYSLNIEINSITCLIRRCNKNMHSSNLASFPFPWLSKTVNCIKIDRSQTIQTLALNTIMDVVWSVPKPTTYKMVNFIRRLNLTWQGPLCIRAQAWFRIGPIHNPLSNRNWHIESKIRPSNIKTLAPIDDPIFKIHIWPSNIKPFRIISNSISNLTSLGLLMKSP